MESPSVGKTRPAIMLASQSDEEDISLADIAGKITHNKSEWGNLVPDTIKKTSESPVRDSKAKTRKKSAKSKGPAADTPSVAPFLRNSGTDTIISSDDESVQEVDDSQKAPAKEEAGEVVVIDTEVAAPRQSFIEDLSRKDSRSREIVASPQFTSLTRSRVYGLHNVGNSCYINTVLTTLLWNPAFVRVIFDPAINAIRKYNTQIAHGLPIPIKRESLNNRYIRQPKVGMPASAFQPSTEYLVRIRERMQEVSSFPVDFADPDVLSAVRAILTSDDKDISAPFQAHQTSTVTPASASKSGKQPSSMALYKHVRDVALRVAAGKEVERETLKNLKNTLVKYRPEFANTDQQDAHELMVQFLNVIDDDLVPLRSQLLACTGLMAVDGLTPEIADPAALSRSAREITTGIFPSEDAECPSYEDLVHQDISQPCRQLKQAEYTLVRTTALARTATTHIRETLTCANESCAHTRHLFRSYQCHTLNFPQKSASSQPDPKDADTSSVGHKRKRPQSDDDDVVEIASTDSPLRNVKRKTSEDFTSTTVASEEYTLQDLLTQEFADSTLEVRCPKCKHNAAIKRCKFVALPRILVLHLNRTVFNNETASKITAPVAFPDMLDISNVCTPQVQLPAPNDLIWMNEVNCMMEKAIALSAADDTAGKPTVSSADKHQIDLTDDAVKPSFASSTANAYKPVHLKTNATAVHATGLAALARSGTALLKGDDYDDSHMKRVERGEVPWGSEAGSYPVKKMYGSGGKGELSFTNVDGSIRVYGSGGKGELNFTGTTTSRYFDKTHLQTPDKTGKPSTTANGTASHAKSAQSIDVVDLDDANAEDNLTTITNDTAANTPQGVTPTKGETLKTVLDEAANVLERLDPRFAGRVTSVDAVKPVYHLHAVLAHAGGANSGHYTTYVRGEFALDCSTLLQSESFAKNNVNASVWREHSDNFVLDDVKYSTVTSRSAQKQVYMLTYILDETSI